MSEYIINKETGKLEMHFEKSEYMELTAEQKNEIKSNFLFSRRSGAWVSRAKLPHLSRAESVAKRLGLEYGGTDGETLTFEEQQERKAERAEARAERMDARADKANEHGEAMQKPINDKRGDIAFFTQPNINSAGGRAFTRQREKMFNAWERGFEYFKKSEYYKYAAETARETAKSAKQPENAGFCERRIKETEKSINANHKYLVSYREMLKRIENGETVTRYTGEEITAEEIRQTIERTEIYLESLISKAVYYHEWFERLGGNRYSRENIKPGDMVKLSTYAWMGAVKVVKCNPKTFYYDTGHGMLKAAYSEIEEIIKAA
jgi:hypothetical protein